MIKRSKHGMAHVYSLAERNKHRLTFSCEEGRDRIPDAGSGSTSISDRSRGIAAHLLRGRHGENVHFLQNGRILLTVNGANFMRAGGKSRSLSSKSVWRGLSLRGGSKACPSRERRPLP